MTSYPASLEEWRPRQCRRPGAGSSPRHQAGWPQAHIAKAMGVSRKCVMNWIDRYAAEGDAGLADRSSRSHAMPTETSPEVEAEVMELRRAQRHGQDWLAAELGLSPQRWHPSVAVLWSSGSASGH